VSLAVDIGIVGVGAVTPVGLDAASSCAALRAGISGMQRVETLKVEGGEFATVAVTGGRVPTEWFTGGPAEDWEWPGHERVDIQPPPAPETLVAPDHRRLIELCRPAAREALAHAFPDGALAERLGIYLGLDIHEPEGTGDLVLDDLTEWLGVEPTTRLAVPKGRASSLLALAQAVDDLVSGRVEAALVGGVDSLIRTPALERLRRAHAIKTPAEPNGIVPGEAAAFLVLEARTRSADRGVPALVEVLSVGVSEEPTAGSQDPNHGRGLTNALRSAVEEAGGLEAIPHVVCDLNGDRYRAMEWSMASIRVLGHLHGEGTLHHPADCIGDSGAASGALCCVWAATAFQNDYAQGDRGLVWGASEGPDRASVLLARAEHAASESSQES
jgi:3-oxoacyl-[acyl-carrier-protein] synthase-1